MGPCSMRCWQPLMRSDLWSMGGLLVGKGEAARSCQLCLCPGVCGPHAELHLNEVGKGDTLPIEVEGVRSLQLYVYSLVVHTCARRACEVRGPAARRAAPLRCARAMLARPNRSLPGSAGKANMLDSSSDYALPG
jgi:hypothetical protein